MCPNTKGGVVIRRTLIASVILLCAGIVGFSYDRSEFLFLDEIEVGMMGVGRTIVADDVISEFAVEILGVIDEPGILNDFIVVQVSGEAIGRAGGIAQGMSGSPVYVDGKLIGAISRAATWSKALTPIGLVTPIEPMLGVIDEARGGIYATSVNPSAVLADVHVVEGWTVADAATVAALPEAVFANPVSTPLVTSGLSQRALGILIDGQTAPSGLIADYLATGIAPSIGGLAQYNMDWIPSAQASSRGAAAIDPANLGSGSSLGVAMASGDISVGSLGTLTYRDGDFVVGYGHPFLSNGSSSFPLMSVSIIDTMKSYEASFKLGTLGQPVGVMLEDRMPGIAGRIGGTADLIDMDLRVADADRGLEDSYSVQLVKEKRLLPDLLLSVGYEAIDTTIDRLGQGTVEVTYRIEGDGLSEPLERRDIFLSTSDIAVYPVWQLASIVVTLDYNAFADPRIQRIEADMSIVEEIRAIQINRLSLDAYAYAPGETLAFDLELQVFQGESRVEQGTIEIPASLVGDTIVVRAYAGPRSIEDGETARVFESLDELAEAIEGLAAYDTVTVELFGVDPFDGALYGVAETTFEFPGLVGYDAYEVEAYLIEGEVTPQETEPAGGTGIEW